VDPGAVRLLADPTLTDFSRWARGNGLEIVLIVIGAELLARFVRWLGSFITARIDAQHRGSDALVRTEAAKHRHSVAQVLTWSTVVLIYLLAAVLVADKLGVPLAGLVAPATVAGVALGFGAQRIVQDILAGFFIITRPHPHLDARLGDRCHRHRRGGDAARDADALIQR
jgi:small-conductance mechanosensitive channel